MAYFANFPKIQYQFDADGNFKVGVDILKRIAIRENIKDDFSVWEEYQVTDGDKPETIAHKLYGDPTLHWVVLFMNDIINPYYEWPMTYHELNRLVDKKYKGQAFFVNVDNAEGYNFKEGDIISQGTKTAKVLGWDHALFKLVVTDLSRPFSVDKEITSENTTATLKRIVLQNKSALHHFEDSDGLTLNPYEHIESYVSGGNSNVITNIDYEFKVNDARRGIRLLQPNFLKPLLREMNSVIKRERR